MQYPFGWVSPFGHRRIKAYCQLPDAFRRLSRPSSPLTAKASTMCAYSLDHITRSRLQGPPTRMWAARVQPSSGSHPVKYIANCLDTSGLCAPQYANVAVAVPVCMSPDACYVPSCQRTQPDFNVRPYRCFQCADNPECAGVAGVDRQWWVWEDSNHRPHPYQGCALTT